MSGTLRTNVLDRVLHIIPAFSRAAKESSIMLECCSLQKLVEGWGPWGDQGRFGPQSLNTQYAQLMPVGFDNSTHIGCIRAIFFFFFITGRTYVITQATA